jgi:hypothetical protein
MFQSVLALLKAGLDPVAIRSMTGARIETVEELQVASRGEAVGVMIGDYRAKLIEDD